jgi:multidrug efflux pump subunit AcrA (membrane-fusion protein)
MKHRTYILLAVALFSGVVFFQGCSPNAEEPQVERPPERQAVRVRAVAAEVGSVQSWVFAEGTARSARREYLTFANPGRVAWVKPGKDGGELREGDMVKANDVLARQDDRQYQDDFDSEVSQVL